MLAFVIAATLTAATPRPLPHADSGIYVPRVDRIDGLVAFMQRAGERSVMLRPSTWFSQFHPLLFVDFTRPESLKAAGLDPSGAATVSFRKDGWMSCVDVADLALFEKRAKERLLTFGTVSETRRSGASLVLAKAPDGEVRAGYAKKGDVTCAIAATAHGNELLSAAAKAVSRAPLSGSWKDLRSLSGVAFLVMPEGVAGLTGTRNALTVDGRTSRLATPTLQQGASAYAALPTVGLFTARARVEKDEVPSAVRSLVSPLSSLCAKCDRQQVSALEEALAPLLTGDVVVAVHALDVKGRMSTDAQRFFAAKQVWLAAVRDEGAAKKVLAALAHWPGARESGEGYAIPLGTGQVQVGVHGKNLYLANDAKALAAGLAAIPVKGGKLGHGVTFTLDPAKTSRTLSGISFFDVVGSQELAGLFAASTELGPLLEVTRSVEGWADSAGRSGHRFGLTWTLPPQGE